MHACKALATLCQCGEPYRLDARTPDFEGVVPWGKQIMASSGISVHHKFRLRTGELPFFNYSKLEL